MEPNANATNCGPAGRLSTPTRLAVPPASFSAPKPVTVPPTAPGFDPSSVRCAVETQFHDMIWKNEDLLCHMRPLCTFHGLQEH